MKKSFEEFFIFLLFLALLIFLVFRASDYLVLAANESISISLSSKTPRVGDFIDATITIENVNSKMLILPVHFNPAVVKVADSVGAIVASGTKTSKEIRSGNHGVTTGQALSNRSDTNDIPLYWNGAIFENPNYPSLDNQNGLYKFLLTNAAVKEIKSETVMTIHFIAVGEGNPDIRFAVKGDAAYDQTSENGAAYVKYISEDENGEEKDVLTAISGAVENITVTRSDISVSPPPVSTGGGGGGSGATAHVSPPAADDTLVYEIPGKLIENSLSRAADETNNCMIIEIEAESNIKEIIIKTPISALEAAVSALVIETGFITPLGNIEFINSEILMNSSPDSQFVICTISAHEKTITIDGIPLNMPFGFSDLSEGHWAYPYIMYLVEIGILNGISDTEFAPDENVTREQFAKMLVSALSIYDEKAVCNFPDLASDSWSYKYVASAAQAGIILGYDDGTFGPYKNVSRQEMAAMVVRTGIELEEKSSPTVFTDSEEIGEWASEAVKKMQRAGIINGMPDGSFAPNDSATRAQAARIIYGVIESIMVSL